MAVGLLYDPIFLEHDTGNHVENRRRLEAILAQLQGSGLWGECMALAVPQAALAEVLLVHEAEHVALIQRVSARGGGWLDPDTVMSPRSYEVALFAAGALVRGVEAVLAGEVEVAFALVRPPGHHATPQRAMGFCLLNNVAIGAAVALQRGLERVLIVDFDVHHGNGTQDAFYEDPRVLYFSTHQYPYYPGTGHFREVGAGAGRGTTLNVPLPAGCGDAEYVRVFEEVLLPVAQRYRPQFILVSAGFDPHWADPLAQMRVSNAGFARMVQMVRALAQERCGGKLVLALEGGYHLPALAQGVQGCLEVLFGREPRADTLGPPLVGGPSPSIERLLGEVRTLHGLG